MSCSSTVWPPGGSLTLLMYWMCSCASVAAQCLYGDITPLTVASCPKDTLTCNNSSLSSAVSTNTCCINRELSLIIDWLSECLVIKVSANDSLLLHWSCRCQPHTHTHTHSSSCDCVSVWFDFLLQMCSCFHSHSEGELYKPPTVSLNAALHLIFAGDVSSNQPSTIISNTECE